jgi:hypothetical protein
VTDPTDQAFYVVLRQFGPSADSNVDEIISDPIRGLRAAESIASAMDSKLTSDEIAAGMRHYCLPHPVGRG